jgi:hypothetical protein
MSQKSLQSLLADAGNPVTLLRNSQLGAYVYPVVPTPQPAGLDTASGAGRHRSALESALIASPRSGLSGCSHWP